MSWGLIGAAAIGTGGTIYAANKASKGGGGPVLPQDVPEPAYIKKLRETIGGGFQGLIDEGPTPYTGDRVAGLAGPEKLSLERLTSYAGQPDTSEVTAAGSGEILKTLAGEYDPETSSFYQAFRKQRLFEADESQKRLRSELAGSGRFFHGVRGEETTALAEQTQRDLDLQNATLADRERQRKLSVLPAALQFGREGSRAALEKIGALQRFGGLERGIDQAEKDAAYQDFVRTEGLQRSDLNNASSYVGGRPIAYPVYPESQFGDIAGGVGSILGNIPWEQIFKSSPTPLKPPTPPTSPPIRST